MIGESMETVHEAITRLEARGFLGSFRATRSGDLEVEGETPFAPESLVVEEIVRFEGASDPGDEAVLFALRSCDGRIHGTFLSSYGTQIVRENAAAIERLISRDHRRRSTHD